MATLLIPTWTWTALLCSAPARIFMANRIGDMAETATDIVLRVSGYSQSSTDLSLEEWRGSSGGLEGKQLELLNAQEQAAVYRKNMLPKRILSSSSHPLIKQLESSTFSLKCF